MTYRVGTGGTSVTGTASIPSRRRLAIVCDDVGLPNGSAQFVGIHASPVANYSQNNWWFWALGALNWPYELVAISAAAGRTTAQAATAFGTEVAAFTPDEVWICLGRNDMTSIATATAALAQLDSIIANCLAINPTMMVRISTVIPGDATSNTTAFQQANVTYNYGVMKRQFSNKNVQVIDMGAVLRDPASATSQSLTGSISASSHLAPTILYSTYMGNYWAKQLYDVPSTDWRPIGNSDVYASGGNTGSNRFVVNPFYVGSGGTATGTTGTVPNSWTCQTTNGVTMAMSVTTDSVPTNPYPKTWLTATLGGTASTVQLNTISPTTNTNFPPLVAGTSIVRARVEMKTTALTGVAAIWLNIQGTADFVTYQVNPIMGAVSGSGLAAATYPALCTMEMPAFVIPTGPTTLYPLLFIQVNTGSTPSGSLSISNMSIEQVV